jgi:hypothetical protein
MEPRRGVPCGELWPFIAMLVIALIALYVPPVLD